MVIDKIIKTRLTEETKGIHINNIVREITLVYAVPPYMVKSFIKECYVELGLIDLKDGILTKRINQDDE
jgi:hypothetical protein